MFPTQSQWMGFISIL